MIADEPWKIQALTALSLASALTLVQKGLRHSRMTPTAMLARASAITGRPYKRRAYEQAITDLRAYAYQLREENSS